MNLYFIFVIYVTLHLKLITSHIVCANDSGVELGLSRIIPNIL
ncbi:Uncharacterised protein [Yersinia enterocolitica]|nr:Uncharacterised protein [Yersinia enterocolitica]CNJ49800.1 Uncharacterised protein [Yersinia enterocolitica]CQD51270.1 Uncharacterised protein [Yersinia enterocolitica]CQH05788.1 Uncharacterised protein [Yersinia enterocolitica]CQH40381.1 Uncharacterised protein [Yersinia enterocolitica]